MIADMRAQIKAGSIIGLLQGREHFEKIVERGFVVGNLADFAPRLRILREQFSGVIGDAPVINPGALQNISNNDIEVKTVRNPETSVILQKRMEELLVVENEVTGLLIPQEIHQRVMIRIFTIQSGGDEFEVISRELNSAIGLDQLHKRLGLIGFSAQNVPNRGGQGRGNEHPSRSLTGSGHFVHNRTYYPLNYRQP
jgi:hypothetical protein